MKMSAKGAIAIDFSQNREVAKESLRLALPQFPLLTSQNMDWGRIYLAYDRQVI